MKKIRVLYDSPSRTKTDPGPAFDWQRLERLRANGARFRREVLA